MDSIDGKAAWPDNRDGVDSEAIRKTDDLGLPVECHSPSGYDIVVMTRKKTGPTWP